MKEANLGVSFPSVRLSGELLLLFAHVMKQARLRIYYSQHKCVSTGGDPAEDVHLNGLVLSAPHSWYLVFIFADLPAGWSFYFLFNLLLFLI